MFATAAHVREFVSREVTARRQKSGLSTRQLADNVGLSYNTVYRIERGDYPLHTEAAMRVVWQLFSLEELLVMFVHERIRECPELRELNAKLQAIQPSNKLRQQQGE